MDFTHEGVFDLRSIRGNLSSAGVERMERAREENVALEVTSESHDSFCDLSPAIKLRTVPKSKYTSLETINLTNLADTREYLCGRIR